MKRLVIAITILVVAVGISVTSLFYVKKTCNEVIANLEVILQDAVTENREEVNRLAVQVNEQWEKEKNLLNLLIGQRYTNEAKSSLNKIEFFAQIGDYESVILHAEECKEILVRIITSNEPNLSTVF